MPYRVVMHNNNDVIEAINVKDMKEVKANMYRMISDTDKFTDGDSIIVFTIDDAQFETDAFFDKMLSDLQKR